MAPHALPAQTKVVAAVLFTIVVVATPWQARAAFLGHAGLLVALALLTGVRLRWLLPRFALETPVVLFAAMLPFLAVGERVALGPLSLSLPGLEGAGLILARATLGLAAALLLVAGTKSADLLGGLRRLRLPTTLVNLVTFMLRFGEVIGGEALRLHWARQARGDGRGRWGRWVATTRGLGVLFVRSYARADRIDRALLARGWTVDTALVTPGAAAPLRAWAAALCLPLAAAVMTAAALLGASG